MSVLLVCFQGGFSGHVLPGELLGRGQSGVETEQGIAAEWL